MENFYDMTNVSKKTVDNAKRIEKQTADFIKEYDTNLRESLEAKETAKLEAAMSGARFGYAANCARSKDRVNALNEQLQYAMKAPVIGMTEMVATLVEQALPLDTEELGKIYPEYKEDIRGIVSGFLKEADINKNVTNKDTLSLMEYVAKTLPTAKEGKSLTEDDLSNIIAANRPENINKSLKTLAGDVSSRVATLMEKEQKKVDEIEKSVGRAAKKAEKTEEKAPETISADELIDALMNGEITEEDLNNLLQNGDITQDIYDEAIDAVSEDEPEEAEEEVPAEEEQTVPMPQEQGTPVAPADAEMDVPAESAPVSPSPKKQIQMLPDGTLNVNIFENKLVKETPRQGLIESLAVNEAMNMLAEGKEYNSDLCLAKAIMYVTITESMDALNLMKVDDVAYGKIINAAGGRLSESEAVSKSKSIDRTELKKAEKSKLNESVLVSQYVPVLNNRNSQDSLAERIRQKRLLQESHQENLNE